MNTKKYLYHSDGKVLAVDVYKIKDHENPNLFLVIAVGKTYIFYSVLIDNGYTSVLTREYWNLETPFEHYGY